MDIKSFLRVLCSEKIFTAEDAEDAEKNTTPSPLGGEGRGEE